MLSLSETRVENIVIIRARMNYYYITVGKYKEAYNIELRLNDAENCRG